ncbi:MAG: SpaA isopeptide-forming pilin-related protein [Eubacteriales bacterium]|nr:SpaA isopeptide-forming pilin-related protein [Eubacteriales bacterium]
MKDKVRKKLMALMLCMVLIICNSISILADAPEAGTTTMEKQVEEAISEEKKKTEEEKKEALPKEEEKETGQTGEKNNASEELKKEEETTEKQDDKKVETAGKQDGEKEEGTTEKKSDKKTEAVEKQEDEKGEGEEKKEDLKKEEEEKKEDINIKGEETTEKKSGEEKEETTEEDAEKKDEDKTESTTEKQAETSSENKEEATKQEQEETAGEQEAHPESLTWENDQMCITVTAEAENAIPAGASLKVTPLVENSEVTGAQYAQVEQQLEAKMEENDTLLAGFLAYDIIFLDKDGKEVEPDGKVKVTMDYKEAVAPVMEPEEAVDVTMYHLEENDEGQVEQVVDMSQNGQMKKLDATGGKNVQLAEFHTDSFSVFTITWKYSQSSLTINAHYGYMDGDNFVEFPGGTVGTGKIERNQANDFYTYRDNGNVPKGYVFQDLKLNSVTGIFFRYLKIEQERYGGQKKYTLKYAVNESDNYSNVNEQGGVPQSLDIYYIFEPEYAGGEGGQGGDVTVEQQLSKTKTATLKDDGSYELALTIAGNIGTITNKAKVDVVMVLDASGSMKDKVSGATKLSQTQAAAKKLIDTLETNDTVDARYNIVRFATNSSSVGWRNGNNAKSDIDALVADGGTNYEAGLTTAKEELKRARQGAMTIVIFLTDGKPTYYGIDEVKGRGNETSVATLNAAMTAASNLTASKFYILGLDLTGDVKIYEKDSGDRVEETISIGTLFQRILNASKITDKASFLVGSTNLAEEFKKIAGDITTMQCSNVTITDPLSQYAQVILDAQGNARNLRVETYKDGTKVDTPSGITPSYDKDTKTITLNFPDEYNLEKGYTYKVLVDIEPTDAAYEAYQKDGYPHTGEEGTGTHANQAGFYSNDNENAVVTYQYNGENKIEKYPKPVIQLKTGDLKLKKTIGGLTDAEIEALQQAGFAFTVNLNGEDKSIPFADFTKQDDGSYTYTLQRLKAGTVYTVNESGYELDGYDVEAKYLQDDTPVNVTPENGCTGAIEKGSVEMAEFINTYQSILGSITIKKQDAERNPLNGAQFKLEKKVDDKWEVVGDIQTTKTTPDGEDGILVFTSLPPADYRITEVKSPTGYSLLANPIEVTLPYKVAKGSEDANVSGDPDRADEDFNYYYNVTYTIQNNQLFTMPEAGNTGTPFSIYVLGTAMILTAAGGAGVMRRRRRARI